MGCKYMWVMRVMMKNINLLCFIHYNFSYFGHVGNNILVYSSI